MKTLDFKTRTLFEDRHSPYQKDRWVGGLDIGYSGIKGFAPNKVFCFPSYATRIPNNQVVLREPYSTDIRFRDESGTWAVGELAYENVKSSEVMDSEAELYGRHRYYSPMFSVISKVGMALEFTTNQFGSPKDKELIIQTGLPPRYLKSDTEDLKSVLAGHHNFELKIGSGDWQTFDFEVKENNIFVMPQPMGALVSASVGNNGHAIAESQKYFSSSVIVFDPGFGTFDDYYVQNGSVIGNGETFPGLGMREVFERTCKDIHDVHGIEVSVAELHKKLDAGEIKVVNKKKLSSKKYQFGTFLENNCQQVCYEAIEKMKSIHNYFQDIDYIIAAGGTYDAWADIMSDTFKDMEDLVIIPANINDPTLSNIFSNVRGYYFYRLNRR